MKLVKCNGVDICPRCEKPSVDLIYKLSDFPLEGDAVCILSPLCLCCWQDLSRAITTIVWQEEIAK